jgi:gamma-glutamylcyclotransferase (GGCT)/AIG2-like uncharacterized protein YtfP
VETKSSERPTAVFVYGTLKRGQEREGCWPREPRVVERATVRGALFDLGPYPALAEGEDVVAGEVWHFVDEDLAATLAALDEVEGYSGGDDDLYRRVNVECETAAGMVSAWSYHYARRDDLGGAQRIKPNADGICEWSASRWPTPES